MTDELEAGEELPKRRPKFLRRLKILECSLVDNPANPHASVLLFKRAAPGPGPEDLGSLPHRVANSDHHHPHEDERMRNTLNKLSRADCDALMEARCMELRPDLSFGAALQDREVYTDPMMVALHQRRGEAPPEEITVEAEVEKSGDEGDAVAAAEGALERAAETFMPLATQKVMARNPGLALDRVLELAKSHAMEVAIRARPDLMPRTRTPSRGRSSRGTSGAVTAACCRAGDVLEPVSVPAAFRPGYRGRGGRLSWILSCTTTIAPHSTRSPPTIEGDGERRSGSASRAAAVMQRAAQRCSKIELLVSRFSWR
jgi:hypothetical protein